MWLQKKHESLGRKDLTGQIFGRATVIEMLFGKYQETRCICECECGNIFETKSHSLITGGTKSCGCLARDVLLDRCSQDLTGQRFGNLVATERIETEPNKHTKYKCLCDCGNTVEVDGSSLKYGDTQSCGCLKMSRGEMIVDDFLKSQNIKYKYQHRFEDCRNERELPFDFYLLDYNACIEFQGIQHYEPREFFGGDDGLKQRKYLDNIKREYCKSNGITLIELPYYLDENEIKEKILSIVNP